VDYLQLTNFILKVLVICAIAGVPLTAWALWLRHGGPKALPPAKASPELDSRLERMETMLEAMSLEVERLTEAQRFNARLLSEPRNVDVASRT
jgi:hypothetical protein